jgi:hypothetical protein
MKPTLTPIMIRIKSCISDYDRLNYFAIAILALFFINALVFTYYNANPLTKSDEWRFISLYLRPWYDGTLTWQELWLDHHPQPLTAMLFIINAELFNLRMDIEALLAIFFGLTSFILLRNVFYWSAIRANSEDARLNTAIFTILASAFYFSLTSTAVYSWPLVTLGHIYLLFAILTLNLIDRIIISGKVISTMSLTAVAISLLTIFFSDGAKILIYASITTSLISFTISRSPRFLFIALTCLAGLMIQAFFFQSIGFESKYNGTGQLQLLIEKIPDLVDYVLYIGVGQLSAWLSITYLSQLLDGSQPAFFIGGIIVLVLYGTSILMFYKHRLFEITLTPVTLIFSSLLSGVGAALFRFNPLTQDPVAANVPRYYLLYLLGVVGVIWIWAILYSRFKDMRLRHASNFVILLFLLSQLVTSVVSWRGTKYRHKAYVDSYEIMIKNSQGDDKAKPPRFMVGANYPEPYRSNLSFLREKQLNLFSDTKFMDRYRK